MTPPHSNVSQAKLDAAYRATAYVAELPDGPLTLRIGEHSLRLDQLLQETQCSTWAFISACNPGSRPLGQKENAARHTDLIAAVNATGLHWFEGAGIADAADWPPEASVLVLGMHQPAALALAARFGQNAVLLGTLGGPSQLQYLEAASAGTDWKLT